MEYKDKVTPKGFLKIQVFDTNTGEELRELLVEKPNLITQGSKKALTYLLSQKTGDSNFDAERHRLWAIYVGDDNTAPATADLALKGSNITKKVVVQPLTITSEYGGIVQVEMTLTDTDHNDKYLRECGLFTRGNNDDPASTSYDVMLARQVHGEIYKTSAITVKYTWRYQITT